jgi:hypothetical protein
MLEVKVPAVLMEILPMKSSTLRQIWSVIEETQTSILLNFSDAELIQQLVKQFQNKKILSAEELTTLRSYLSGRVPLIRDMALARLM